MARRTAKEPRRATENRISARAAPRLTPAQRSSAASPLFSAPLFLDRAAHTGAGAFERLLPATPRARLAVVPPDVIGSPAEPELRAARGRKQRMKHHSCGFAVAAALLAMLFVSHTATAQKPGGMLRTYDPDSPGGMSIMEEATVFAAGPLAGVFNNLVMFDQHVPQNSLDSLIPDLATSWSWNEDGTKLTFTLRQGVKWHDGQPFTARDVKCTWDLLMGTATEQLRINPRKSSFYNLAALTTNGDFEVTFQLNRPQPAFLMLLGGGFSVIYPCHVSPQQMRQHPIGTGPFKFVEFKPNEDIKVVRNPD